MVGRRRRSSEDDGGEGAGLPEGLAQLLGSGGARVIRINPGDMLGEFLSSAQGIKPGLEEFCEELLKNEDELRSILARSKDYFGDREYLQEALRDGNASTSIFVSMANDAWQAIGLNIETYLNFADKYKREIRDNLGSVERVLNPVRSSIISVGQQPTEEEENDLAERAQKGANGAIEIFRDSMMAGHKSSHDLKKAVLEMKQEFGAYEAYLRERFIKPEDTSPQKMMRGGMMLMPVNGNGQSIYAKVKLYRSNPMLTDAFLKLVDLLPEYSGEKTSSYAIDDVAEKLSALADPKLFASINDPTSFFRDIGSLLEEYFSIVKKLTRAQSAMFSSEEAASMLKDSPMNAQRLSEMLENHWVGIDRNVDRIKRIDLGRVVQDEDDVAPDNQRESELFRIREGLFDLLYDGLADLGKIKKAEDRFEKARKLAAQASALKNEMQMTGKSPKTARIRHDKYRGHEYYEAKKSPMGEISFVRMPSPSIRVDDVIGASFDRSKALLSDTIDNYRFEKLLSATAPDGKLRNNLLLFGAYGCGKTQLGKAYCSDQRVVGANASVSDILTALMHESPTNFKRLYELARELREGSRDQKQVLLVIDEFDGFFTGGSEGYNLFSGGDMKQVETTILEVLDGMRDYSGVTLLAMSNNPNAIPKRIIRRFAEVEIVGELNLQERAQILSMYTERRLPVDDAVRAGYDSWAAKLEGAPGDVVKKVVDNVHRAVVMPFVRQYPDIARKESELIASIEADKGRLEEDDLVAMRDRLRGYGCIVGAHHVDSSVDVLLAKPSIVQQINSSKEMYKAARRLLHDVREKGQKPFSLTPSSHYMDTK